MENTAPPENNKPSVSWEEFDSLVKSANSGCEQSLRRLREVLDENPAIWQRVGDVGKHAEHAIIRAIAGENKLISASIEKKLDQMRRELLEDNPSLLEQLAVQRVLACYLECEFIDSRRQPDATTHLPTARYVLKLKDSSQRRFDAAMKSLVLIKEKLPAIQAANLRLVRPDGSQSHPQQSHKATA